MKNRMMVAILAISMACMMVACGEQEVTGNVTATEAETVEVANDEVETVDETEAVEEEEEVTEEAAEEVAEEVEEDVDANDTLGLNAGNTYENAYFGVRCELSSDWTLESEEQILARNKLSAELVGDELGDTLTNAYESGQVITDMVAVHSNGMDTVNMGIEKLMGPAMLITEEQYLDLSEPQLIQALTDMGLENINTTRLEVDFAGNKHAGVLIEAEYSKVPVYEELIVMKNGRYIMCTTAATWEENKIDDVLAGFSALQ